MTYQDREAPTTQASVDSPPARGGTSGSTADEVRNQAREAKDTAGQAATDVATTAKEQAGSVASEAQAQTKRLLGDAQNELNSQASNQQQRAASGLRSLGDELRGMADKSEADGPATSLAQQAGDKAASLADWLENKEPGDVLNEVKRFARRRPGAFLALSAGAGLLAARFARGLSADSSSSSGNMASPNSTGRGPAAGAGSGPVTPTRAADVPRTPTTGEPALATPPSAELDPSLTTSAADAPYPASSGRPAVPGQGPLGDGRGAL